MLRRRAKSSSSSSHSHMALSFSGGGLVASAYHLGVYQALCSRGEGIISPEATPLVGASAGALVAATLASGCRHNDAVATLDRVIQAVRGASRLGPFGCDLLQIVRTELETLLPEDAHSRCSDRVCIFLTDVSKRPWQPRTVETWDTRAKLIDTLLVSSYIPWVTSRSSPAGDKALIDGGFRANFPIHPTASRTVRVSPFSGELDICPEVSRGKPRRLLLPSKIRIDVTQANAYVVLRSLFPPADTAAWLEGLLACGYDDGCRWLKARQ